MNKVLHWYASGSVENRKKTEHNYIKRANFQEIQSNKRKGLEHVAVHTCCHAILSHQVNIFHPLVKTWHTFDKKCHKRSTNFTDSSKHVTRLTKHVTSGQHISPTGQNMSHACRNMTHTCKTCHTPEKHVTHLSNNVVTMSNAVNWCLVSWRLISPTQLS